MSLTVSIAGVSDKGEKYYKKVVRTLAVDNATNGGSQSGGNDTPSGGGEENCI